MPCTDPRDNLRYEDFQSERSKAQSAREENAALKIRCDHLTSLLCQAGQSYLHHTNPPADVLDWWKVHYQWDLAQGRPWKGKQT